MNIGKVFTAICLSFLLATSYAKGGSSGFSGGSRSSSSSSFSSSSKSSASSGFSGGSRSSSGSAIGSTQTQKSTAVVPSGATNKAMNLQASKQASNDAWSNRNKVVATVAVAGTAAAVASHDQSHTSTTSTKESGQASPGSVRERDVVVVHQNSNDGFFTGWLFGSMMNHNNGNQSASLPSPTRSTTEDVGQTSTSSNKASPGDSFTSFGTFLLWLVLVSLLIWGLWYYIQRRQAVKNQKPNYSL